MQKQPKPLRERVERGIYKRKTRDGKTVRYEIAYVDREGKQRWETVGRLDDARKRRAELVSTPQSARVAKSKTTLSEYADAWLEKQKPRLRPKTYEIYESSLRLHVKPRLGRRRLDAITVDDVASLIGEMERGVRYVTRNGDLAKVDGKPYAGWTVRAVLVVIGRVFASAVRDQNVAVATNPVRRLDKDERPRIERRKIPSLDAAMVGKLITSTPKRYRTIVALSVLTGLRQSEALGLRWQDIDVKAGVVHVRHQLDRQGDLVEPKTGAAKRDVPIPPSLGKMLAKHRLASRHSTETDFVFASSAGTSLGHRNIVRRGLEKGIAAACLPKLTWHDLRHVAASVLISQGASVAYLSRVLGHASPAITLNTYAHLFAEAEHADATRDQMEAAYGKMLR